MNAPINSEDFARLNALGRQIRDGHEAVEALVKLTKKNAQDALREAILAGNALANVKQIVGSKFEPWVQKHCKSMDAPTAWRYLELSKSPLTNLGQAYGQLGIMGQPLEANDTAGGPPLTCTEEIALNSNLP